MIEVIMAMNVIVTNKHKAFFVVFSKKTFFMALPSLGHKAIIQEHVQANEAQSNIL